MPAAITWPTASAQRPTSSNAASSSSTRRGSGSSRTVTSTTTPSSPSEPITSAQQVEARRLARLAAERQQLAVHGDELHLEHVVDGQPVLEAMHAARVLGDVAADRARDLRGRIRRVVEAVRRGRLGHREVGDAGLHARETARADRPRGSGRAATAPAAGRPRPAARRRRVRCPTPRATTGTECRRQMRRTTCDLLDARRQRDQVGPATVGGERVALEGDAGFGLREQARRRGPRASSRSSPGSAATGRSVCTPASVPTSSTSAPRCANSPLVTTPANLVDRRARAPTGSTMSRPRTSRMSLPLSVTMPWRQAGWPPSRTSSPRDVGARHRDDFDRQRETVRAARPASASSTMQTKRRAAAATIFSRVSARAAALDQVQARGSPRRRRRRRRSSSPIDIQVEHRDAVSREAA